MRKKGKGLVEPTDDEHDEDSSSPLRLTTLDEAQEWAEELKKRVGRGVRSVPEQQRLAGRLSSEVASLRDRLAEDTTDLQASPRVRLFVQDTICVLERIRDDLASLDLTINISGEDGGCEESHGRKLDFLAEFSRKTGRLAKDDLVLDQFRNSTDAAHWTELRLKRVLQVGRVPTQEVYSGLCDAGLIGRWFQNVWAHQFMIFQLGEITKQVNLVARHALALAPPNLTADDLLAWGLSASALASAHFLLAEAQARTRERAHKPAKKLGASNPQRERGRPTFAFRVCFNPRNACMGYCASREAGRFFEFQIGSQSSYQTYRVLIKKTLTAAFRAGVLINQVQTSRSVSLLSKSQRFTSERRRPPAFLIMPGMAEHLRRSRSVK